MRSLLLALVLTLAACDTADPCDIRGSSPATVTSDVSIDYRGQLENGTVVDEQYCFEANLSTFVVGFQEGVVGMVPGEEKVITVPPEKGYGAVQRGPIPPNSTLIFAVRLRSVD
ncbi:MAG: FKBP-type peptidyl-prolyl cis-trans isomerase [Bacteroidota bacterium]